MKPSYTYTAATRDAIIDVLEALTLDGESSHASALTLPELKEIAHEALARMDDDERGVRAAM